jgi:hypothetical protein
MHRLSRRLAAIVALPAACLAFACLTPRPARAADDKADKPVDYKKEIQPLLKQSCLRCHGQNQNGPGGPGGGRPGGGGGGNARPGGGGPGGPGGMNRGPAGGFRLDDHDAALKGGKAGNDIVPGKAEDSLMFKLLSGPVTVGDKEISQMPKGMQNRPGKPLTPEQIDLVKRWINQGAKFE